MSAEHTNQVTCIDVCYHPSGRYTLKEGPNRGLAVQQDLHEIVGLVGSDDHESFYALAKDHIWARKAAGFNIDLDDSVSPTRNRPKWIKNKEWLQSATEG